MTNQEYQENYDNEDGFMEFAIGNGLFGLDGENIIPTESEITQMQTQFFQYLEELAMINMQNDHDNMQNDPYLEDDSMMIDEDEELEIGSNDLYSDEEDDGGDGATQIAPQIAPQIAQDYNEEDPAQQVCGQCHLDGWNGAEDPSNGQFYCGGCWQDFENNHVNDDMVDQDTIPQNNDQAFMDFAFENGLFGDPNNQVIPSAEEYAEMYDRWLDYIEQQNQIDDPDFQEWSDIATDFQEYAEYNGMYNDHMEAVLGTVDDARIYQFWENYLENEVDEENLDRVQELALQYEMVGVF